MRRRSMPFKPQVATPVSFARCGTTLASSCAMRSHLRSATPRPSRRCIRSFFLSAMLKPTSTSLTTSWAPPNDLLRRLRDDITKADASVEGFNIGANVGVVSGQNIFHCHIHLIPRRKGDIDNPHGGVRAVIPDKMRY